MGSPGTSHEGYHDADSLAASLRKLAGDHPNACRLSTIGSSRQGRPLWVLELGRGEDRDQRTAMAIVAGIDGDFPVGSAVALRIARGLLSAGADDAGHELLSKHTVYILPRVNPDAIESFFATPQVERRWSLRPVDDDRDGQLDEDGPEDLNGDGLITQMRVHLENRRIGDLEATHLPDPEEPRLLKKADRSKGERPVYALLVEGVDNDGDEAWNEDGPGGVDVNRNFSHGYKEHEPGTGPHQISEPESKALIDFFLKHSRITIAVYYGRHDNIAKAPKPGKKGDAKKPAAPPRGRRFERPKPLTGLHKDDVDLYGKISKDYREITAIEKVPDESAGGAAFAWTYAEYGIPTFACRVWSRPEEEKPKEPEKENGEADPAEASESEAGEEQDSRPPDDAEPSDEGKKPGKNGGEKSGKGKDKEPSPNAESIAWLKFSDEKRDGAGFIDWTPLDHPQLGEVEIGGFAPFFRTTPTEEELDALAEKQLEFVRYLGQRFPEPSLAPVEVTRLSDTVFEIRTALVNDGYFPTGLGAAQLNRRVRPIVIALDIPLERIIGGNRIEKIWSVPGSGGRHELRWVVRGAADSAVGIDLLSEKYGDTSIDVKLTPTGQQLAP